MFKNIDAVAIITIPADFTRRVEAHQAAPIDVVVNNLNLDFTNDIRRSVADAITQFYQAQGSSTPVKITMHETDLRSRDVQLFQYSVIPTIALLLMISGLVNGGLATAREWETRTVKELLLSPAARAAIIAGKVLAGFMITFCLGTIVLLLSYALAWTQPEGIYWLSALLTIALISLFSSGLGVALGAALQKIQAVIGISINVALYLYFLAGGIGVLAFEPDWLQNIAAFIPLTYGRHALEMAETLGDSRDPARDRGGRRGRRRHRDRHAVHPARRRRSGRSRGRWPGPGVRCRAQAPCRVRLPACQAIARRPDRPPPARPLAARAGAPGERGGLCRPAAVTRAAGPAQR